MDSELKQAFARLVKLIEDTSQSLQAEMAEMRAESAEMRAEMEGGFARVEAATRRNTTTITGGALAIAALNRWAKARDTSDARRDRALNDLRRRVGKVERRHRKH